MLEEIYAAGTHDLATRSVAARQVRSMVSSGESAAAASVSG
ncbi:hypothetical protein ACWEO2_44000 [Nocardia sp. NPDC004278]